MRAESIEKATARQWDDWLRFLMESGADQLDHPGIASLVERELGQSVDNPAWWAQSITVAFERAIGRRLPGQQPDGSFQVSVSKSTQLGMHELAGTWKRFAATDDEVLAMLSSEPRTSGTKKRLSWRAKGSEEISLLVTSEPKPNGAAAIRVQVDGIATPEAREAVRMGWTSMLERFVEGL